MTYEMTWGRCWAFKGDFFSIKVFKKFLKILEFVKFLTLSNFHKITTFCCKICNNNFQWIIFFKHIPMTLLCVYIFTSHWCDYYSSSSNIFSFKKYSAAAIKFESRNFSLSLYFAFIKDTNDSYMEKYYPIINAMITLKCLFSLSLYSWQYVCSQFSSSSSSYFLPQLLYCSKWQR